MRTEFICAIQQRLCFIKPSLAYPDNGECLISRRKCALQGDNRQRPYVNSAGNGRRAFQGEVMAYLWHGSETDQKKKRRSLKRSRTPGERIETVPLHLCFAIMSRNRGVPEPTLKITAEVLRRLGQCEYFG